MNYLKIKELAQRSGCAVTDLLVLAPQNDPFYVGTKSQMELAEWFVGLWKQFAYTQNVHLRRIYYQIVSQKPPVVLPNGKPFENNVNCAAFLDRASKYARYLGLVDPAAFNDQQASEPVIYVHQREEAPGVFVVDSEPDSADLSIPDLPDLPDYRIDGFEAEQLYHLEVWIEKSTMNDVLEPICKWFQATLVAGKGELSITRVKELINRICTYKRPCRIFYLSDFDPAGKSMPVAVSRKIEFFLNGAGPDADVRLFPIVLSREQCEQYELPRTPIKESERRGARFEERFGEGATELDALEAIHAGALAKILTEAMSPYFDSNLDGEVSDARETNEEELAGRREKILENHQEEIDRLREDHKALQKEFSDRMRDIRSRTESIWQAIGDELVENSFNVGAEDIPKGAEADEIGDGLYNTARNYMEQMVTYKEFQGRPAGGAA